ncbi:DsbA family oxidoreductase [Thauera sp. WH-2]|jgi:predicted DsbA family dithiol-disulfide isomerase|uniref:DsbA family oxidoreductase n=1 Tax=unclassified Thauera TaxID=2609274 RepID=UPI003AAEB929
MILNIDLVSDFVCPWCFLAKVRLDRALEELKASRPDLEPRVNWLPFFLNPDTPAAGEPYREFLESKFGGPIKTEAALDKVREAASADGLHYAFERITLRPNTLDAHRLMYRAQAQGQKPERIRTLAHALFAAHFQEGRDIGDRDTLAGIAAASCGERSETVREWLDGRGSIEAVERMAAGARKQGIEGVPFFILNRRMAVSGAQSAAVLGAAVLQSLETGKPS